MRSAAHTPRRLAAAVGGLTAALVLCEASLAADLTGSPVGTTGATSSLTEPVGSVTATATSVTGEGVATGAVSETPAAETLGLVEETRDDVTGTAGDAVTGTTAAAQPMEATATATEAARPAAGNVTAATGTVEQTVASPAETATKTASEVARTSADALVTVDTIADGVVTSAESVVGLDQGTLGGVVGAVTEPVLEPAAGTLLGDSSRILDETLAGATGTVEQVLAPSSTSTGERRSPDASAGSAARRALDEATVLPTPGPSVGGPVGTERSQIAVREAALTTPPGRRRSDSAFTPPSSASVSSDQDVGFGFPGIILRADGTAASAAEPRPDRPLPLPTRHPPAAPPASVGTGSSIVIVFAVLACLALLACPRAGRRLLPWSALAPPTIFASPLERPG